MGELRRALGWAQGSVSLFHFRTRDGVEVDIVCEDDNRNVAGIEVKASASITLSDFRGLTLLRDKLGDRFTPHRVRATHRRTAPGQMVRLELTRAAPSSAAGPASRQCRASSDAADPPAR